MNPRTIETANNKPANSEGRLYYEVDNLIEILPSLTVWQTCCINLQIDSTNKMLPVLTLTVCVKEKERQF